MAQRAPSRLAVGHVDDVVVVQFQETRIVSEEVMEQVAEELFQLVDVEAPRKLLLNFRDVRFMSSEFLAKLMQLNKKVIGSKGKLALCCLLPIQVELLHVTRLDRIFEIFPDEATALTKF